MSTRSVLRDLLVGGMLVSWCVFSLRSWFRRQQRRYRSFVRRLHATTRRYYALMDSFPVVVLMPVDDPSPVLTYAKWLRGLTLLTCRDMECLRRRQRSLFVAAAPRNAERCVGTAFQAENAFLKKRSLLFARWWAPRVHEHTLVWLQHAVDSLCQRWARIIQQRWLLDMVLQEEARRRIIIEMDECVYERMCLSASYEQWCLRDLARRQKARERKALQRQRKQQTVVEDALARVRSAQFIAEMHRSQLMDEETSARECIKDAEGSAIVPLRTTFLQECTRKMGSTATGTAGSNHNKPLALAVALPPRMNHFFLVPIASWDPFWRDEVVLPLDAPRFLSIQNGYVQLPLAGGFGCAQIDSVWMRLLDVAAHSTPAPPDVGTFVHMLRVCMRRPTSTRSAETLPCQTVAVLLAHGGSFAGVVSDCTGETVLLHATIHRYIHRRGQGGRQSSRAQHTRTDTAGSQLRAYNETRWVQEVQSLLLRSDWAALLQRTCVLAVHTPGPKNTSMVQDVLKRLGLNAACISFTTHQPTYQEAVRVLRRICSVRLPSETCLGLV